MPPVRPTDLVTWATMLNTIDNPLVLESVPLSVRENGYVGGIGGSKPAARHWNYLFKNLTEWNTYFVEGGLAAILEYTTLAAIKAATSIIANQTAYLTGVGFYKYDSASVLTGDDVFVIDPDAAGAGRWIMIFRDSVVSAGQNLTQGRLTLVTATAIMTTAQTAKTTVYFTPYQGNLISLYSGTLWQSFSFSEISIKLTDAQSGHTTSGNAIISGLTDTSQLAVGMKISGTNVGAASVIVTIDSNTQITGSVNSTGTATNTITFKVPASTPADIFAYNNSGTVALKMKLWTNGTTRATALALQDGVYVRTDDHTRKYLGTICTTSTDGQTEWSFGGSASAGGTAGNLLIWNYYNRKITSAQVRDNTNSYSPTSSYAVPGGSSTFRVNCVIGISEDLYASEYHGLGLRTNTNNSNVGIGIGIDATNANSAQIMNALAGMQDLNGLDFSSVSAYWEGYLAEGFHFTVPLITEGSGQGQFFGDNGNAAVQTGLKFKGHF
jgi:hypothetical protein